MPRRPRDRSEAEARLQRLTAYLAPLSVRPPQRELAMILGCCDTTIVRDLELLRARGVAIPPARTPGGQPGYLCTIVAALKQGQRGWVVWIKGDPNHPDHPPRTQHWCADLHEAIAIQAAIKAGGTLEGAIQALCR